MARLNRHAPRHAGWTRRGVLAVAAAVLLLWLTGIALYAWPAETSFELARWQLASRRAALVLHGCTVWVLCLFAGHWLWAHVAGVWGRRRRGTWMLGAVAGAAFVVIAGTGLLLLYGPQPSHAASAQLHWWTAVGLPLLLAVHARTWSLRR